jgi:Ser/Thr protein kinase RdoA (MazF antagonist)
MLPLSEIAGLQATVDGRGCSAVADAAAAPWGLPAGAARFWRSSACHVFRVPDAYLRFVPAAWRDRDRMLAAARYATALRDRGENVAAPLPSLAGRLVETIETARGPVHAMLVSHAPGEVVEHPSSAQAHAWGAALARLHTNGDGIDVALPPPFLDLYRRTLSPDLAAAAARIRNALDRLPRRPESFGLVHGDFELDNLAWAGDRPTAYDFDDAHRSWFVADIAYALRDVEESDEFLTGYRSVRDLPESDLAVMPLFVAAHAASWLTRLPSIMDSPASTDDPAWLTRLRTKLVEFAQHQREILHDFLRRSRANRG